MATAHEEVKEVIREMPGLTFEQIADLCSHLPRGTVSSALHVLKLKGDIAVKTIPNPNPKPGKAKRFTINVYDLGDGSPPPPPRKYGPRKSKKPAGPTPTALEYTNEQLKAQIAELEEWKANAIRRFPDLAVAPHILAARKLVAEEVRAGGDKTLADHIIAGHKDGTLMVKVAIKALESVM